MLKYKRGWEPSGTEGSKYLSAVLSPFDDILVEVLENIKNVKEFLGIVSIDDKEIITKDLNWYNAHPCKRNTFTIVAVDTANGFIPDEVLIKNLKNKVFSIAKLPDGTLLQHDLTVHMLGYILFTDKDIHSYLSQYDVTKDSEQLDVDLATPCAMVFGFTTKHITNEYVKTIEGSKL